MFSRFNPLVYFCLYRDDSFYECLELSLSSLAEYGSFGGTVGVACDRPANDLLKYVPVTFHDRLIVSQASADRGWFNRYHLDHGQYDSFQPILYCDVDVVFDASITDLLIAILIDGGICCATETSWGCPRIAQQIALAFGVELDKGMVRRVLAKH